MKKVTALFLLLACMLAGCGQKEALQEVTPTQKTVPTLTQKTTTGNEAEFIPIIQTSGGAPTPTLTVAPGQEVENAVFRYEESAFTECFAVDKEGLLYTITGFPTYTSQLIKIYDWDGNCMEKQVLKIGSGKAENLIVGENHIYVLMPETDCANVLYQIDRTTWEAKRLYDFTEFEAVYDMVLLGDTMYVLAEYENYKEKEFVNYQDWYQQTSNGRDYVVAYLQVMEEAPELAFVPFDLPMYIFAVDENTLGIYGQYEKSTCRLFAYSPAENTFQGISASYSLGENVPRRPFQYYEEGIFMVRNLANIYYVSQDETEHEVFSKHNAFYIRSQSIVGNRKVIYANGCLFYQEYNTSNISRNIMERVNIEDKLEEILQAE